MELDFGDYWEAIDRFPADQPQWRTTAVLMLELVARMIDLGWQKTPSRELRISILRRFAEKAGAAEQFRGVEGGLSKWARSVGFDVKSVLTAELDPKIVAEKKFHLKIRWYLESKELADFYYDHARGREYRPRRNTKDKKL